MNFHSDSGTSAQSITNSNNTGLSSVTQSAPAADPAAEEPAIGGYSHQNINKHANDQDYSSTSSDTKQPEFVALATQATTSTYDDEKHVGDITQSKERGDELRNTSEHGHTLQTPDASTYGAAASLALNKLRGRLMLATGSSHPVGGSTVRSASAPNLRRDPVDGPVATTSAIDNDHHDFGPLKRSNTQRSATGPIVGVATGPARPPLISKQLLEPTVPVGKPPGWRASLIATVRFSWLNVLLVAVPVAWGLNFSNQNPTAVFVASMLAIVPCAALLGFATEELALRVGDALGGLLNATFGNAVELIISIFALVRGDLRVVQSAMLGSILSNCLLVLGMCYFAGGLRFHEQGYGIRAAQVNINLLGLAIFPIVILVGYHIFVESSNTQSVSTTNADILNLSHGIAILLLLVYVAYLTFQLWTHAYLYAPPARGPDGQPIVALSTVVPDGPQPPVEGRVFRIPSLPSWGGSSSSSETSSIRSSTAHDDQDIEAQTSRASSIASSSSSDSDPFHNIPQLSVYFSVVLLLVITGLTAVTAEALVGSIEGLVESTGIQREFVALILLPLVGNAAEHLTAVVVARRNKLDLSMAVAVGSSIQIALFVIPFLVLLGWCIGQPLTLFFDPFEVVMLFLSVVAVNWAIADGKTNWLEGFSLMMAYVIIAVVTFYYPGLPEGIVS